MRRAVVVLLLLAAVPVPAIAANPIEAVDAIGNIDYRRGADFKVGDWVQYRCDGSSALGKKTEYIMTILIAGATKWWGEDCFWVETQVSSPGLDPVAAASLLSYDVFKDSLATLNYKMYIRKFVHGFDEQGKPSEELFVRVPTELTSRKFVVLGPSGVTDTVGVERIQVPKGAYDALKVVDKDRPGATSSEGDSTVYTETSVVNTRWWSNRVPLTSLVRFDVDRSDLRRAWVIGNSANAPLQLLDRITGKSELLDYGTGMKSMLFKGGVQRPVAERPATPAQPPARPTPRKGSRSGN